MFVVNNHLVILSRLRGQAGLGGQLLLVHPHQVSLLLRLLKLHLSLSFLLGQKFPKIVMLLYIRVSVVLS